MLATATVATLFLAVTVSPLPRAQRHDPYIPTLEEVVGHKAGEGITKPEDLIRYAQALGAAAPEHCRVIEYGRSHEGRPLQLLVIGRPDRIGALDSLKKDLRKLADPRGLSDAEAARLTRDLPVVVLLLHAVHGNEVSPSDSALYTAWYLLSARQDETVQRILQESVVLLDPLQNPDGRARFLAHNEQRRGVTPSSEPLAAERDETWPGGRGNHDLFDMNRDWFALSQPETRARVALLREWQPHVVADLHEMGGDSTYFFPPPASPMNPHLTGVQREWLDRMGRGIAERFDSAGVAYFVREVFDAFYPGYGESWPLAQGSIGMTFEQASTRGLLYHRTDGTLLHYAEAVAHHVEASLGTVTVAASSRQRILSDLLEARRTTVREGATGAVREYALLKGRDPARTERLGALLEAQGIEVRRLMEEAPIDKGTLPSGTLLVSAAQPSGRLVRNLLDVAVPIEGPFLEEQARRHRKGQPDEIYDVTAWSLPLLAGVDCKPMARPAVGRTVPFGERPSPPAVADARVAWLMPWGTATAAGVVELVRAGHRVFFAEKAMTLGGHDLPPGTAFIRKAGAGQGVREALTAAASRHGFSVHAADTGFSEKGISLGSGHVRPVRRVRIVLAWDSPTSSLSAGWARHVLERRYALAPTVVRVASLARLDWSRVDVLVLPSGSYDTAIGEDLARRIRGFVQDGGVLVTLGEASRWATWEKVGLLSTHTELRDGSPEPDPAQREGKEKGDQEKPVGGARKEPFDLENAIRPEDQPAEDVPGALLKVSLDEEHWLSAGAGSLVHAVVESRRAFTPLKLDKGVNVGLYAAKEDLVTSGVVWRDTKELLPRKAWLMHEPRGRGHVIAFAEDPNFRAYAEATELLFLNAVLLAPGPSDDHY